MFFACMYVGAAAVIREPRMDIQEAVMIANTTEPVLVIMGVADAGGPRMGVADAGGMEDCFKNPAGEHSTDHKNGCFFLGFSFMHARLIAQGCGALPRTSRGSWQ